MYLIFIRHQNIDFLRVLLCLALISRIGEHTIPSVFKSRKSFCARVSWNMWKLYCLFRRLTFPWSCHKIKSRTALLGQMSSSHLFPLLKIGRHLPEDLHSFLFHIVEMNKLAIPWSLLRRILALRLKMHHASRADLKWVTQGCLRFCR